MANDILVLKHILPLLIPMIAILGGVLVAIVVIALDYRKKTQLLDQHHKERLQAIERGIELPPLPAELLGAGADARTRPLDLADRSLRHGLMFLLVGLALAGALAINHDTDSAAWGLIPMAIGLANLIYYRLARKT